MARLVRPNVRQSGRLPKAMLPRQRLNQARVSDAVTDRRSDDEVSDPASKDHGYQCRRTPKDVEADEFSSKVHPLSLCTPPAKNAPVDLDGSTRAGLGVCAHNSREWASVIAHAGAARYHRARFDDVCAAGLKASAARHKKAAEHHERYLRNYADGLLSGLHLF